MSAQPWEQRMDRLEGAYDRLDAKIDAVGNRLDAKIDAVANRLDAKIDRLDAKIEAKVDGLRAELSAKFDVLAVQMIDLRRDQMMQFRWVVGLILISILIPLVRSVAPH